jgi:esterase FrsA
MNDVDELKQFALLHARAQDISPKRTRELLRGIHHDDRGLPGSWVWEWRSAAETLELRGSLLDACRYYNMARFPYVDGAARQYALDQCVTTFERWRRDCTDIQQLNLSLPGGQVKCWATSLSSTQPRPLLLMMGGIVSIKEQWAPVLTKIQRLGMAGIVTEMPGVGENTLCYDAHSWQMLPHILDAVSDRADVAQTYAMALSFSGHLALRCAIDDSRIKGIVTAGAPVTEFFTDTAWQRRLPRLTVETLAHVSRTDADDLPSRVRDWALTEDQLTALDIPVCYVASHRDEIIPGGEIRRLRGHVRRLQLLENDDVHGSPNHLAETRLWTALSVLRMRRVRNPQRAAASLTWRLMHTRARLGKSLHGDA